MPFVQRVIEPKYLSRTTLFHANGSPKVADDELEAVTNNTLSNALRQLASLVLVANDIFTDLTIQLEKVTERSIVVKEKIGVLEGKVVTYDPKKVSVPEGDIATFALLKDHYKARHEFTTNLFSTETRPNALRVLYETAAKTPIHTMRQMDRWRRDGHRTSRFFLCTPVLGAKRRKIRNRVDIDIETRMPAAVEELRRWTSAEALGDVTVTADCLNRIVPNITFSDGNVTDGTLCSDDEAIDHKLPSPEEQLQVVALKFPAEVVAVDVSGRRFDRMAVQRRSLLHADVSKRNETDGTARRLTRPRKPRSRRRNTLAGTDQKEIHNALTAGDETSPVLSGESESPESGAVFRSKSSDLLRSSSKKESPDTKKSHFYTLKQWGKNRLKMINRSAESKSPGDNKDDESSETNIYETVTIRRKRSLSRDKKPAHERKPSYSSSEKSSVNLPISTPLSAAMSIAVKLRESSVQRRYRRSGDNKDEPHSSSGNWSASSESGRASVGSEITTTTQPKSSTSVATSSNSLHAPSSVNSRRKFNFNTSASSSVSEGTLTPDIHDFHEDGETSSVYSCDTEGYYTSFHMDSGLKTLKEEDMPVTPLHSTTAFSNSSSNNTVLTAENEYELFGKGSTSTTASSAGTVCTTLKASLSNRSLVVGPAVPERKSSLVKLNNKENKSPESSLERDFSSDKTGTVKRSPANSTKATVVAVIHKQSDGDVSPDSGHNTSSSPIESANSPNDGRSGSEFEFSECSDMEGADRIERIRVKTTINSSRIPSMCVITPPHSDDESVNGRNSDSAKTNKMKSSDKRKKYSINNTLLEKNLNNSNSGSKNTNRSKLDLPLKPLETDLDSLSFADSENEDNTRTVLSKITGTSKLQLINVNRQSGYATVETIEANSTQTTNKNDNNVVTSKTVRAPSPSGGSVTVRTEETTKSPQTQPLLKATLLPLNNVFGRIKSNLSNFTSKKDKVLTKREEPIDNAIFNDDGEYVTIADVRNNNEKTSKYVESNKSNDEINRNVNVVLTGRIRESEYISLNELPCNVTENPTNSSATNDSLERRRRQGARVTLDAEGKVVYSSDSLKRRKGCHTTFEPGPYVKEIDTPSQSPLPIHRTPLNIRPVNGVQNQTSSTSNSTRILSQSADYNRPLSPQFDKVVIRASAGMTSPTSEIVRIPPTTIVTPTVRPMSPKANNARGAYVYVQDSRGSLSPTSETERVASPCNTNLSRNLVLANSPPQYKNEYQTPIMDASASPREVVNYGLQRANPMYQTLPPQKSRYIIDDRIMERPITPDITKGLPSTPYQSNTVGYSFLTSNRYFDIQASQGQYPVQKLGIPVRLPQVVNQSRILPQVPYDSSHQHSFTSPITAKRELYNQERISNISPERFHPATSYVKYEGESRNSNESIKISPIDPRSSGGFQSSTPSSKTSQDLKAAVNLESRLLSPKKSTMSSEELYAVIHKGKKKLNISEETERNSPVLLPDNLSPAHSTHSLQDRLTPAKVPETGYLSEKTRSRFSWSPSDGEYVDYNTNIDKISPNKEAGTRQSWACSDRKGNQQTSRMDFKKLLLQHSVKSNPVKINKKLSAVEQLKLSKEKIPKSPQPDLDILELSGSPRNLQNRKFIGNAPGSPRNTDKSRPAPKLMSPRSQWRFTNPRTDVLSSTILEDCREDESPNNSSEKKRATPSPVQKLQHSIAACNTHESVFQNKNKTDKPSGQLRATSPRSINPLSALLKKSTPVSSNTGISIKEQMKVQRAQFFNSPPPHQNNKENAPRKYNTIGSSFRSSSLENRKSPSPPTLETAF